MVPEDPRLTWGSRSELGFSRTELGLLRLMTSEECQRG